MVHVRIIQEMMSSVWQDLGSLSVSSDPHSGEIKDGDLHQACFTERCRSRVDGQLSLSLSLPLSLPLSLLLSLSLPPSLSLSLSRQDLGSLSVSSGPHSGEINRPLFLSPSHPSISLSHTLPLSPSLSLSLSLSPSLTLSLTLAPSLDRIWDRFRCRQTRIRARSRTATSIRTGLRLSGALRSAHLHPSQTLPFYCLVILELLHRHYLSYGCYQQKGTLVDFSPCF